MGVISSMGMHDLLKKIQRKSEKTIMINLGENYGRDIRKWVSQRTSKPDQCDKSSLNPLASFLEAFSGRTKLG